MKYESQRVAWWFFATCMLLFSLQIIYGFIMGFAHAGWDGLHAVVPFHAARATHTNLLVMWLLCGFMGAAYYIIPEEADRELESRSWPTCSSRPSWPRASRRSSGFTSTGGRGESSSRSRGPSISSW